MMRKICTRAALIFVPLFCKGQADNPYPTNYFRNPLDIPITLAGNFGECRPGHFHSGLDIRTQGKENLKVHAAADGYISRIKTESGGYGHAIYITHPNGYTTLYAHLNKFTPALQKYLRQQQYLHKRWNLDLSLPANKFPVKKGQLIAWSGNTGASSAPHLHFEIRDSRSEHPLNPQLFGLTVVDHMPPVIRSIAFYRGNIFDRDAVNFSMRKHDNGYIPVKADYPAYAVSGDTIDVPDGDIGVAFESDDYMEGSDNTITFYTARLFVNDSLWSEITLDNIGYDVSRYIHAYTDYYARQTTHKWLQCFFRQPGNQLSSLYTKLDGDNGRLQLEQGKTCKLRIELTDDSRNVTTAAFVVRPIHHIPTSVSMPGCTEFKAGKENEYSDPNFSFTLDDHQLYDDICFSAETTPDAASYCDRIRLHYPFVPLHHYFTLMIKPNKPVPFALKNKLALVYSDGKSEDGQDAKYTDGGWYKGRVRQFGTYTLVADTIPPVIKPLQKNGANLARASKISFHITDETTSVATYKGLLDGKWICFEQHRSNFFYEFDGHCTKGKHTLKMIAEDENGNEASYTMTFLR